MPRKIGDHWYTDFRYKTQRIRRVLPEARTQDQAKRAEARMRDQYFEGSYGDPAAATVFIEFAEKVWLPWCKDHRKTPKGYRNDLLYFRHFQEFFGQKTFAEITSLLLEKYKRQRRNDGLQPASVNRELAALSKIFRFAKLNHLVSENPVSQVKRYVENNARTRFLSPEEEARLFDALLLNPTLTAIVTIALNTGMRQGEILKLEWRDVNFREKQIHVRDTKSGHDRFVPMNSRVDEEVQSLPREKGQVFLFPGPGRTGHLVEIKKAWATALRIAGIKNFRFHDLRHTAGTRFAATGAHPNTIKKLLGHQRIETTERYMHALEDQKRQAVAALETFGQDTTTGDVLPFRKSG